MIPENSLNLILTTAGSFSPEKSRLPSGKNGEEGGQPEIPSVVHQVFECCFIKSHDQSDPVPDA